MRTDRSLAAAIFFLLFFAYGYINQGWGWNQNSRLDLLHALVVKHQITIDAYHENTGDKAEIDRHFYSEKAPGIVAVALPSFALSAMAFNILGVDIDAPTGWKISSWVATLGSVGLLAALGGMCLFLMLRKRVGPLAAFIAVLAVFLGSMPFPYATMLFSHAGTMGLLAIALWAFDASGRTKQSSVRLDYLSGFVSGLAVAGEYPAAIAAGILFIAVLFRGWRSALRFVLGAFAPLLLIPGYNWLVSGSIFNLGYSHVDFDGMKEGFFGASLPKPSVIFAILISQFRGLFFWSPFLLLAIPGYRTLYRTSRPLFFVTLLAPIAYILFASSYVYWDGGYAFGPRHLSAAVPFLAVAAGVGFASFPATGIALALFSIVLTGGATVINALTPNSIIMPLVQFYPLEFAEGRMAFNLGRELGLSNGGSILVGALLLIASVSGILFFWSAQFRPSSLSVARAHARKDAVTLTGLSLLLALTQVFCMVWSSGKANALEAYLSVNQWDSVWYESIVDHGYQSTVPPLGQNKETANVAFFPGYPLAVRLTRAVLGVRTPYAMALAAQLAAFGCWLYILLFLRKWKVPWEVSVATVLAVFVHPAAFFLVTGYAESLFLFLLLGFLYWTDDKRRWSWIPASAHGFAMSATRLPGIVFAFYPVLRAWIGGAFRSLVSSVRYGVIALSVLLGTLSFFLMCQVRWGAWDLYFQTQDTGWGLRPTYGALVSLKSYVVPPLMFILSREDDLGRFLVPVTLLLLVFFFVREWRLRRTSGSTWEKDSLGFVAVAFLLFCFLITGAGSVGFRSIIRYLLPVHVLMILYLARSFARHPLRPPHRRAASIALLLFLLLSFTAEILFMYRFTHRMWVA